MKTIKIIEGSLATTSFGDWLAPEVSFRFIDNKRSRVALREAVMMHLKAEYRPELAKALSDKIMPLVFSEKPIHARVDWGLEEYAYSETTFEVNDVD